MSPIDQAKRYLDAIPGAVSGSGGHNQTFSAAMCLVEGFALSTGEARPLLADYAARCDPPWNDREIDHKLADAERYIDPSKLGKLRSKGVKFRSQPERMTLPKVMSSPATPKPEPKPARYEVSDAIELPSPMADGTRLFLKAAFDEGDGIRIAVARFNEEQKEIPKDSGVVLSREEWLRKLDAAKGNPNKFLNTSDRNGIFISVNPMRLGGSRDSDVTSFRHALLEFDNISLEEQWGIITASKIPCSAVISSGGKSIHAWVRVDAKDRNEFADRVKILYQHFADYAPDEKNKNPSRFSRLPNCERGQRRQELLALDIGCESFGEWLTLQEVDSLGTPITPAELEDFDSSKDQNNLLGNRWLGRGMACLEVGPSGIGKSSLSFQKAVCWAIGRDAFGIKAVSPLKSLIVQAENDRGDLSEMFKGICSGLGIEALTEEWELLRNNLVFISDDSHTGQEFCENLRRLIERHKPDLVWLDPILSFVGADISRQEVIGQFFRNWLNPILHATGVACFCIHHTGKPPSDKAARQHWQTSDFAYAGLGSSDLTNWARAVMVLQDRGHGVFELKLAKRGKRAGILTKDGMITTSLWLKHASNPGQIFWEQTEAPEEECEAPKEKKLTKPEQVATMNLGTFLSQCPSDGESLRAVIRRLTSWLASKDCPKRSLAQCSHGSLNTAVGLMLENEKLSMSNNLYFKGPKA